MRKRVLPEGRLKNSEMFSGTGPLVVRKWADDCTTAVVVVVLVMVVGGTEVASGAGDLPPILDALRGFDAQRQELEARFAAIDAPRQIEEPATLRQQLADYLADWRRLLNGNVHQAQQILLRLIKGKLVFMPHADGYYKFSGVGTVEKLMAGRICPSGAEGNRVFRADG
jgi:hypothetical protein